jgi:hypothetical protein
MNHPTTDKELREKLASIEHERWADWQNYVHRVYLEGNFKEFMLRWQKQIGTPYSELSDQEKASDMEQVNRYWHLIEAHTAAARIDELNWLPNDISGLREYVANRRLELQATNPEESNHAI